MKQAALLSFILFLAITSFGQLINSTVKRDIVHSAILNDDREISVYLPPSYYASNQNYPVLYILDGDYNFFYVSGLIELQSAISENIPEMILVGISGKGTETYRKNCKPNIEEIQDSGNADKYAEFIEKEIVSFVNENYRTANYKILAGHSVGGLFIINTVLNKPNSFSGFIAISPALWWEKNAINDIAIQTFESNPNFSSNVYISLANEQGMGVDEFLDIVEKYNISDAVFKFNQFPNENHNSVGLPTYIWALTDIFSEWKGEVQYFSKAAELKDYHDKLLNEYGTVFNLQTILLAYTVYVIHEKSEDLEEMQEEIRKLFPDESARFNNLLAERLLKNDKKVEAEEILIKSIKEYPEFFNNYNLLAKLNLQNENLDSAKDYVNQAVELATRQKARQWQLNELLETKVKVEAAIEANN